MNKAKKVYLDYAATTPVDKKVLAAMMPYLKEKYGNASSLHSFGREAAEAVEKARNQAADFLKCDAREIIFTSGATESNNLAVKGVIRKYQSMDGNKKTKPHVITTSFEHHCVLDACKSLEKEELAEVTYIKPDKNGIISVSAIKEAIKNNTVLISVMYVNNEIGTIQPIAEIGKMLKNYKLKAKNYPLVFHTDATQAINYLNCEVDKLGVDLLSFSAHKIYGPKGIGALYIRKNTLIRRVQDGGEQEFGLRAGTLNVPGIVGLGAAISMINGQRTKNNKKITALRDHLIRGVLKEIPKSRLNGSKIKRSPNNANFTFLDVEGESLILLLDQAGVGCSTGSACSSGTLEPSHVLLSIGLKPEEAHGSIRVTLGKHTTRKEIDYAAEALKKVVRSLRKVSGNVLKEYYENR